MNAKLFAHLLLLFALCVLTACAPAGPSPNAKRYDMTGKVVSVERDKHLLTIVHEDIKELMPAMTMSFTVKDNWVFEVVKPGDQIAAAYVVDGTKSWLENVVIKSESTDTGTVSGSGVEPQPGVEVPNFRLLNQDNKAIRIHDYKGKSLLVTFVFTRCQDPDQCTLMSSNFAAIDQELQKQPDLLAKTHLLTITFDPEYDTPKVMRSYGASYTGKYSDETFSHWEFATGTPDEVKGIAQFFGMRYYKDSETGNEQMIHTLRTVLIGPDSKVVKIYRGNDWKPEEVLSELKK